MHLSTYVPGWVRYPKEIITNSRTSNKLFHISIVSQLFIIILTYFLPTYVWVPT